MQAFLEDTYRRVAQGSLAVGAALELIRREEMRLGVRMRVDGSIAARDPLLYYRPVWEAEAVKAPEEDGGGPSQHEILVFGRDDQLFRLIQTASRVPSNGHPSCVLVLPGGAHSDSVEPVFAVKPGSYEDIRRVLERFPAKGAKPLLLLHAWNFPSAAESAQALDSGTLEATESALRRGYETVFHIVKALGALKFRRSVHLVFLHPTTEGRARPENAALGGLILTAQRENRRFSGKLIGVEGSADAEALHAMLRAEWVAPPSASCVEIRYRGGRREVRRFVELDRGETAPEAPTDPIRRHGVYLLTGGLGGLGRIFARELAERHKANLLIIGRSEPNSSQAAFLRELAASGSGVAYRKADVTRPEDIEACVRAARSEFGPLRGVVHSAGVIDDALISGKTAESFARVLAPKVKGTLALDLATRDEPLDFFVMFSSLAAVRGNLGQSDYSAGNRFMDQFAETRDDQRNKGQRSGRSLSINWPLWKDGGMRVPAQLEESIWRSWGMRSLERADGIEAFYRSLALPYAQVGVLAGDRSRLDFKAFLSGKMPAPQRASATRESLAKAPVRLAGESGALSEGSCVPQLAAIVAEVLKVDPKEIKADTDLHEYGVDSILLTEIVLKIDRLFDIELGPNDVLENPTLRGMSRFLIERIGRGPAAVRPPLPPLEKDQAAMSSTVEPPGRPSRERQRLSAETETAAAGEPIAVIAMACRFPGADSPEQFWENLHGGKCFIREVPSERLAIEKYFSLDQSAPRKSYSKWGGFIGGIEDFDAGYFSIGETEATGMDPQHRIALELTQELFDRAGYRREELRKSRTGVFLGGCKSGYAGTDSNSVPDSCVSHAILNTIPNMMAGRVANFFDLRGSAETLDTACSSSLVAIHRACRSLAFGEMEMAIAGGISLILDPFVYVGFSKAGALARSPVPYIFDERANGFCMGEGAGLVLLKPLARALADGDQIAAVILGSGTNNDGHTMGWTTPNMDAQKSLLEETYRKCHISAAQIGYLEAHGTGTLLGDPIEVRAATQVFSKYTQKKQFCGLGSVKSNVGHTLHAAGACGFIKTVLALQNAEIPPTLHCDKPHPRFKFHETAFFLPHAPTPFAKLGDFRCAAVSAFGFGGTNCHIVVREWNENNPAAAPRRRPLPATRFNRKRYWLERVGEETDHQIPTAMEENRVLREEVEAFASPAAEAPEGRAADSPTPAESADLVGRIETFLIKEMSGLLQVPADEIDVEASFDELGLDSTSLVETAQRLEQSFKFELYPTLLFEHSTIRRLSAHLAEAEPESLRRAFGGGDAAAGRASEPASPTTVALSAGRAPAAPLTAPDEAGKHAAPDEDLALLIENFLARKLSAALSVESDQVSAEANFMEMGLDSVGLVQVAQDLERELGIELYPTLFFEYQNIRDLARYFSEEHGESFSAHFKHPPSGGATSPAEARVPQPDKIELLPAAVPQDSRLFDAELPPPPPRQTAPVPSRSAPVFEGGRPGAAVDQHDIAIIGMAGRFPESDSLEEFWDNLCSGRNLIREIPLERWDYRPLFDTRPQAPSKLYCKWGSFVKRVSEFDAPLFNIGEGEARSLDPQLRLFLEVLHSAADDAGYGARLAGSRTGVYVGSCYEDYQHALGRSGKSVEPYDVTGNARTMLANRASYFWDLRGPSLVLDTACSSSLVAIHLACQALRNGECDMAVAGGINLILTSERYLCFCSLSALSPSGRCHSFDGRADGYVPGEAVACVLLKPLSRALRDGDPIHAVIKGSAIAHGGHANTVTAPNPRLEAQVIAGAWADARIDPSTLSYIEAHGTGTKLGDPVEVQGLSLAFGPSERRRNFCAIGTAKAHMGHAEGAAGIVGLVKTVLSMEHRLIPAMPDFNELNPLIKLEESPFFINRAPIEWRAADGQPLRAGISSFGFGGTYAHLVVESFQDRGPASAADAATDAPELFVWSGASEASLHRNVAATREWMRGKGPAKVTLGDIAHTLQAGRKAHGERVAIIAASRAELGERIDAFLRSGGRPAEASEAIFRGTAPKHRSLQPKGADPELRAWQEVGNLEKLAAHWAAGGQVNWTALPGTLGKRCVFMPAYSFSRQAYWFERVVDAPEPAQAVRPPEIPKAEPAPAPTELLRIQDHVAKTAAALLRVEATRVDLSASMASLGLDSIMSMQLARSIQEHFGLALFSSEALAQPNLRALAVYIHEQMSGHAHSATHPPSLPGVPASTPVTSGIRAQATPFAPKASTKPILFLLSSPRSGSTLLRVMLAGHSRLFCPPELHLLAFATMGERGKFFTGPRKFLNEGLIRALMELKQVGAAEAGAVVEAWEAGNSSTADVFASLQDLAGDRLLVDKSPSYGESPEILRRARELFPAARYIHLMRHPCAMMESFVRNRFDKLLGVETTSPWRMAEEAWTRINRNILELMGEVGTDRWLSLKYEDLVAQTDESARELCRFLEIPFQPALLNPYEGERMTDGVHAVSLSIGDPNFLKHDRIETELTDAWKGKMPPDLELATATLETAASLGYRMDSGGREASLLSPAQRLLLAMAGPLPKWNIVHRLRFSAETALDRPRMEEAWKEMIRRHPQIGRLLPTENAGSPGAGNSPEAVTDRFSWHNASKLSSQELEDAINREARDLNERLDSRNGPLLGGAIFEIGEREYELLTVVDHLSADGISVEIMLRDLLGRSFGGSVVGAPEGSFSDYCRTACALEGTARLSAAADYFRARAAASPFLVPAGATAPGGDDEREIQAVWRPRHSRWPAAAFDGFATALYRTLGALTGGRDPVVSHRLHGRSLSGRTYSGVVGDFAYDVPIALPLEGDKGHKDVARIFRAAFSGLPDVPYPLLVLAGRAAPAHELTGIRLNFQPYLSIGPGAPIRVIHRQARTHQPPDHPVTYALDLIVRADEREATVLARFGNGIEEAMVRRIMDSWRENVSLMEEGA